MTRDEILNGIMDLYFIGVPLKVAISDFKDEIKKLGREKKDGICKVSTDGNELQGEA
jgi:hypothetical protein